jgi:hypothetical protein
MKKYDRETKSWVEPEVIERKQKKRKLCKGGREHDWLLCLPRHVRHNDSILGFNVAEEYYKIHPETEDMELAYDERLELLGIKSFSMRISRLFGRRRSYVCSVCNKQK